jgi:hypothetical protein
LQMQGAGVGHRGARIYPAFKKFRQFSTIRAGR